VSVATYWNGLLCPCRKVTAIVIDSGRFTSYWARTQGIVGERIAAVEVNRGDLVFYIDDRDGHGWAKVTSGYGSPCWGHRNVEIEPGSVSTALTGEDAQATKGAGS
jgi:hypothetical protein